MVLVCSAAPVMADPAEPPANPEGEVLQASEYGMPSPESIAAAHLAAERAEEEHEADLEAPAFVAERESSRHAYANATPAEAEQLLLSTFAQTFANLNAEPARLLSDVTLDQNLGHGSAVITDKGKHEILEADMPVEAANAEGETGKVNLSLEQGPEAFEAENPLVELSIGKTADEGVEVGDEGLAVTQAGAEESTGRLLGDKNVFYGEVEAGSDTDLMVSPTAHGVELFDMLRSVDSPETLRFDLGLPQGDTLRAGPGGGAEVVDSEGATVAIVPKPHGEDAQGTYVPVELEVEGDSVLLHTDHREEDLAYPALVDPELVSQQWGWWWEGQNLQGLGYWGWGGNTAKAHQLQPNQTPWSGWQSGLFMGIESGELNAGDYAGYYLNSPNTGVYLANVEVNPFQRADGECWPYREPYDFEGYYDVGQHHWNDIKFEEALNQGYTHHESWGQQYEFGLEVDVEQFDSQCWRELAAGGFSFQMGDWGPPTISGVSGAPTGWIKGSTEFTISAVAEDGGLGVKYFVITPGGGSTVINHWTGCQGTYESQCPHSASAAIHVSGSGFSEGERQVLVSAEDPTLSSSNSESFTLKVDRTPPNLQLHGQLMTAVNEAGPGEHQEGQGGPELNQPVYNLKIDASDGVFGTSKPEDKRSGVKKVEVLVEKAPGETVKETYENESCAASSCELHATYPLKLTGLSTGTIHKLEVKAYDFAGNQPETKQIEFEYMPATGISEDFVLQRFPLPDGKNHDEEDVNHGPELAVNVMNGNVVYHQRDIDVEGPSVDLETELFYNSQLPKEQSSEWGRGWTLAQTPRLGDADLPQEEGQSHFSNDLNAVVTKRPGGGYALSDEAGHPSTTTVYNSSGQTTEVQTSPTASLDYTYKAGKLSELAVDDPGATTLPPPAAKPAPPVYLGFITAFGSTGSGPGQLNGPRGVAADGKGHVWVVDRANNRVQEFTEAGEYLGQFGSAGSGNGQFNSPWGIAVTPAGNIWVADTGNQRLQEFNAKGEFIQKFGTKAPAGSKGTELLEPEGIAIAPGGYLWVADCSGNRVAEFRESVSSESERFVRDTSGAAVTAPVGVAVDGAGNLWVAEETSDHLLEFAPSGSFIRSVGSSGSGDGQLDGPEGLAVGPSGNVYVADLGNDRVDVFSPSGQFLTRFGSAGAGNGDFSEPRAIAFGAAGAIFVSDKGNNRVHKWGPAFEGPPSFMSAFGTTGSGPGQLNGPRGVAADGAGHVWVVDRANNRVQEFTEAGEYLGQFGSAGSGNGQFNSPWGIAVTPEGNLWVTDTGNYRVQEFNAKGEFIQKFGTKASGASKGTELLEPEGIAVAPGGYLWVSDCSGNRVAEFRETVSSEAERFVRNATGATISAPVGVAVDATGNLWVAEETADHLLEFGSSGSFIRSAGSSGSGNGQLDGPQGLAVGPSGNVYVADLGNDRVEVFSPEGRFLTRFGTSGSGDGNFSEPKAIAFGAAGAIFVSDKGNNRVHRWGTAGEGPPTFFSAFGATGSGPGQLNGPRGVAADGNGHVWVVDRANNRVQEFTEAGEYLGQFGSAGSGNGQFNSPWGIAVTPEGNIWVTDTGNCRVQEFNAGGEFLQKFGARAVGTPSQAGKFLEPEGIAVAPDGMLWVADNSGGRIAEFRETASSEAERFVRDVATTGTGNPGLVNPLGLAVDPDGNLWAADETADRLIEYSPEGTFLQTFGSQGSANGQLDSPKGVGIGPWGGVYVVDWGNDRVDVFSPNGEFLTRFGSAGAGNGDFSEPRAIAFGAAGAIFVSDKGNNRVHKWGVPVGRIPGEEEVAPVGDDPAVSVQRSSGLISSVSGVQAGQHTYSHQAELLSADQGSEGTTTYEYDASGRLTKVTLPNGTIAEVEYDATGRATKVSVDPAGSEPAKSTSFSYAQEAEGENRQTTVEPEKERRTFYLIGADGSVLRWWNAEAPPTFRSEAGSFVEGREKELHPGDQKLFVEGEAAEGVKTIQFIVNGNTVVDEKTCTGTRAECEREHLEWITNTSELPPGTMWIEAVLTDTLGRSASKRWWVTVPYIPPPPPGVPQPPRYKDVLHFREEFGLDLDLNPVVNELELHERVLETIGWWHNPQTPLGEVAYAAWERWGVPLRPADVAELEYREAYVAHDGPLIESWAEAHIPSAYAGYYVDNRAGGIIEVGFTENASALLAQLEAEVPLTAPGRISAYTAPHNRSRASLESAVETISAEWGSNATLNTEMTEFALNTRTNTIEVGAENVAHVQEILVGLLGSQAPLSVHYSANRGEFQGRYRTKGKMLSGDEIQNSEERCTAGPGLSKSSGTKPNGEPLSGSKFLLVPGHCAAIGEDIYRGVSVEAGPKGAIKIGHGARTGLPRTGGYASDGTAVVLESPTIVPNAIVRPDQPPLAIRPADTLHEGDDLCFSGASTEHIKCGPVLGFFPFRPRRRPQEPPGPIGILISAEMGKPFVTEPGDSGAPVWDAQTKAIVGMVSGFEAGHSMVAPLLPLRIKNAASRAPGILAAIGGDLTIETGE